MTKTPARRTAASTAKKTSSKRAPSSKPLSVPRAPEQEAPKSLARELNRVPAHLVHFETPAAWLSPEGEHGMATLLQVTGEHSLRALRLGLTTRARGFHVFVSTPDDVRVVGDIVAEARQVLADKAPADDVIYVHDFARPEAPRALMLPAGQGPVFAERMRVFLDELADEVLEAAESDRVRKRQAELVRGFEEKTRVRLSELEEAAKGLGFSVKSGPGGLQTRPVLHGKPLTPEQFTALDAGTKRFFNEAEAALAAEVERAATAIRAENIHFEQARDEALGRAAADVVAKAVLRLKKKCASYGEAIQSYLDAVGVALARDWEDLVTPEENSPNDEEEGDDDGDNDPEQATRLRRFKVNAFVTRGEDWSPVVHEAIPNYANLFGYLERRARFGALLTDFTRVRAGALHRASGGVLVIRAQDLLTDPMIWERLKRTLRDGQVSPEDPTGPMGLYATTLRPAPVKVDVRLMLVGSPSTYAALLDADPDFAALFRVKVEVDGNVPRTAENVARLDAHVCKIAAASGAAPLSVEARAELMSYASRLAGRRDRLSLSVGPLEETAVFAEAKDGIVSREEIMRAWSDRRDRTGAAEREFRELIRSGEIVIDVDGTRVGCINGLSVLSTGDVEFGQPVRITTIVALGREGLIDVEREAQLGGSIHTKGMAILRGYLSRLFGQERPLSLRAQLAFEQSYGEIDGDSASAAELFALLSSLADVGIDQGVAVTGSINQLGAVQAIGGVCAKIEGFYDVCRAKGWTGKQGVMMPRVNLDGLILREDVAGAIEAGEFSLYAIENVAQGIEVLTGIPAGDRDESGRFPAGSVFGRVERRLIELAERLRDAESPRAPGTVSEARDDASAVDLSTDNLSR